MRKPENRIFAYAFRHLQCNPQECVFVANSVQNLNAAQEAGINAIRHIRRYIRFCRSGTLWQPKHHPAYPNNNIFRHPYCNASSQSLPAPFRRLLSAPHSLARYPAVSPTRTRTTMHYKAKAYHTPNPFPALSNEIHGFPAPAHTWRRSKKKYLLEISVSPS